MNFTARKAWKTSQRIGLTLSSVVLDVGAGKIKQLTENTIRARKISLRS